MSSRICLVAIVSLMSACSFVQLSDAGAQVAQMEPADVANCTSIGEVSSRTRDKVVISRGSAKVQEELLVLARNEAAGLGANAIVPLGEPENGEQRFRAYRCE